MQTILVLEDDTELNQTICFSLEREGYRVLSAGSCGEAGGWRKRTHWLWQFWM